MKAELFVKPNRLMLDVDIWFLRVDMFIIAACYIVAFIYLLLRVKSRLRKADGIFMLAITYSLLTLSITFI